MTLNTTHRKPRRRKSYAARTGMDARSSKIIVNAMFGKKPEFSEDEHGNLIHKWLPSESSSYSNADLAACLCNRVAVECVEGAKAIGFSHGQFGLAVETLTDPLILSRT